MLRLSRFISLNICSCSWNFIPSILLRKLVYSKYRRSHLIYTAVPSTIALAMTEQAAPQEPTNTRDRDFTRAVRLGIQFGLSAIESSYANPIRFPESVLAYHSVTHSLRIIKDTQKILQTIQRVDGDMVVSDHMVELGGLGGALHDVYQEWYTEPHTPRKDTPLKRKRAYGVSEARAASLGRAFMEQYNLGCKEAVFTSDDIETSEEAVRITMASYDGNRKTITQPNFPELKSNLVAAAVALADLGGGGMHGWDTFRWELFSLFKEENIDIAKYIDRPAGSKRNAALE